MASRDGRPGSSTALGVWGSSATNVFAVGENGTVLQCDGSRCRAHASGTKHALSAVWGSSGADIFAVGHGGVVIHYDGKRWATMQTPRTNDLRGVWGSSAKDVFVVGEWGTFLHYDGSGWRQIDSANKWYLGSLTGASARDLLAVAGGDVVRYDGTTWKTILAGLGIASVWRSTDGHLFAVGAGGAVLHRRP